MSTTTSIEIIQKDYSKFENFDSTIKGLFISSMVSIVVIFILILIAIYLNKKKLNKYNKLLVINILILLFTTFSLNIASAVKLNKISTDYENIKKYYIPNVFFSVICGILVALIILKFLNDIDNKYRKHTNIEKMD